MIVSFKTKLGKLKIVFMVLVLAGPYKQNLDAQEKTTLLNGLNMELKPQYGFVYPHSRQIQYLLGGNIKGLEISLTTHSNGRHIWENIFRYPKYGVSYNYTNLSSPDILGTAHAVFGYMEIPFYRTKNNFSLNYQIDFGIALLTKKFSTEKNPLNIAISSNFNLYVGFDIVALYSINKSNSVKASLELAHYSNGKVRSPNLGINAVNVSAGWIYTLTTPDSPESPNWDNLDMKRHYFELIYNHGFKRDDMLNTKLYYISSFVFDYYYAVGSRYAFGAGTDLFYDGSLRPTKEFELKTSSEKSDNFQTGMHLGFRIRYGKFNVIINLGHYINADYTKYTKVYSRLGMRYYLTDRILCNFTIKAHYANADFLEWGMGYRFKSGGH